MKVKNLFLAVLAGVALLSACQEEENLGTPKISVEPAAIAFGTAEDSAPVQFTATRDWLVASIPDWVALSVDSGKASTEMQTITVSVDENQANDRTGEVIFTIGLAKAVLTVTQDGPLGPVQTGSGTLEDPFTVAGVVAYVNELGSDVQSDEKVYVKGKISAITEAYSAQYGNGTFYMTDDGNAGDETFYAYRILYLGNAKWNTGDTQIEVGDDVVVYGYVVNYKGNTPETVQNGAFLYSLNGVEKGGNEEQQSGDPKGSGTLDDPYNPAGANAFIATLGADVNSDESVYVKGIVSSVKEAFSTQYGNASFYISEDGTTTAEQFYVFRTLYLNNEKYTSGDNIKEGDEVVIYGKVVNYRGNTPETVQNQSYLYSLNGAGGSGSGGGGDDTGTPSGSGTLDDPYNAAAAIAKAVETGETATSEKYYIKGIVVGTPDISTSYGNATFYISDDGTSANQFYIFRIYSFGGEKFTDANAFKEGDEVVVYAQIVNYKGNTPETVQGGELVSVNGEGSGSGGGEGGGGETGNGSGTLDDPYTADGATAVASALASGSKTDSDVYVKGKISSIKYTFSASYGTATFFISADGSTSGTQFQCYSVYYLENKAWVDGNTQVEVGDEVIICGKLTNYNGTPETASKEAYIYSLNGKTSESGSGGEGGGGETGNGSGTLDDPYTADGATAVASALASGSKTDSDVYVKGKISSIKYTFSASYGTATFFISADGSTSGTQFQCYSVYYLENKAWVDGNTQVEVGDEVIICGKLTNYNGTPETASKEAYIYSLNGKTSESGSGGEGGGGGGETGGEVTVSVDQSFLAANKDGSMDSVVSYTNSSDYGSTSVTELRVYKGQTFVVTAASGYTLKSIEFTCTASGTTKQGPGCWGTGAPDGYTYDGTTGTWTGSASSVSFTAVDNQVRIKSLTVKYVKDE